jgi:hypothetical protein
MSIINDALKKAAQNPEAEPQKTAQEATPMFRPELLKTRKARANWRPFFLMGILIAVLTPLVAPLFSNPYKTDSSVNEISTGSPLKSVGNKISRQFAVEEAPLFRMTPNFSLNGLVYSTTDSYCLINGKVMRVGDSVEGAMLSQVTPYEAVLDYRGEKIILTANGA